MNIFANRAVLNDPSIYHDPSTFNPDRFNPALTKNVEMDPTPVAFCVGLGRRSVTSHLLLFWRLE